MKLAVVSRFVPVRIGRVFVDQVRGHRVIVRWSAWVFRGRVFGKRREWGFLDG